MDGETHRHIGHIGNEVKGSHTRNGKKSSRLFQRIRTGIAFIPRDGETHRHIGHIGNEVKGSHTWNGKKSSRLFQRIRIGNRDREK
jgi:ribosomal protein L3